MEKLQTPPPEKGRVSIYSGSGSLLESSPYYSQRGRLSVMLKWREDYSDEEGAYFQIYPHALDKEAPKHLKKKYIREPIEKTVKFVRPPAVYDNKRSLYDISE